MTFGDPQDFAIETLVEPDLTPPSAVWGRMQVWCRGRTLGNIEDRYCHLGPAYAGFQHLADRIDENWDEALRGLGDRETFNFFDVLLYGYRYGVYVNDGKSLFQVRVDAARYGHFNFLTNWGEQFDGYKSFLVCPPAGDVRILSRKLPSLRVDVSRATVVGASSAFTRWYEEQERRLRE